MSQEMRRRRSRALSSAALAVGIGSFATADALAMPYVNVSMLGKDISQGQSAFSANLQVNVGDTVVFQILTYLAATGATNTSGSVPPMSVKVNNTDGLNTLTFDAYQLSTDQVQVDFRNGVPLITSVNPTTGSGVSTSTVQPAEGVSLVTGLTGWKNATGANGGSVGHSGLSNRAGGNDIIAIRPGQSPGTFRGLNSSQAASSLGTGLFVVTSLGNGALSTVKMRYTPTAFGGQGGGFQYNAGTTAPTLSDSEELGPDPFVKFNSLTLGLPGGTTNWNVDASGSWSQNANWTNGRPNDFSTSAIFGPIITAPRQVTVDGSFSAGSLTFSSTNSYTLSGPGTISLGGSNLIVVSNGSHTISASLSLPASTVVSVASNSALSLSGAISGGGGINATGAGTILLSGSNSYTGGTTISTGTVNINSDAALGNPAGGITLSNGGTLQMAAGVSSGRNVALSIGGIGTIDTNGFDSSFSGKMSGSGGLTKAGNGALALGGSNTYSGATTVNAGTLRAASSTAFSSASTMTLNSGATLDLNSFSESIGLLSGAGSVTLGSATLTIGGANSSSTFFSGPISGAGNVVKAGPGSLTLSGSSTYTGTTTLNAGSTVAGIAGALAPTSRFIIATNANLNLASLDQTIGSLSGSGSVSLGSATLTTGGNNDSTTFSGGIGGGGSLIKTGSGAMTLSGSNTYSGNTTVNGGELIITGSIASPANARPQAGGTLDFVGGTLNLGFGSLHADAGGTIQYDGVTVNGGFLYGPGTHNIASGSNTFSGVTTFAGAVLQQNAPTTLNSFTNNASIISNAALTWSGGSNGVGSLLSVNNVVNLSSVNNAGQITVSGTGTLNNQDSNLVSGGGSAITVNTGGQVNLLSATTLELNGALLTNNGAISGDVNAHFNSAIAGNGSFSKVNLYDNAQITGSISTQALNAQNASTATLSGAKTTASSVAVIGNGRLTMPAGGDKVIVLNTLSIDPGAQLDMNNNALIVNYGSDTTSAARATIRNLLINGRNAGPASAAPWNGTGGITSTYAHNNGNGFNLALGYADNADLSQHNAFGSYTLFAGQTVASNNVLVRLTRGGDCNLDGIVDGKDVSIVGNRFMRPGSGQWNYGDFDYSGLCDGGDVAVLGSNYGKTAPLLSPAVLVAEFGSAFANAFDAGVASGNGGSVPEPSSAALLFILAGPALRLARRPRRGATYGRSAAPLL